MNSLLNQYDEEVRKNPIYPSLLKVIKDDKIIKIEGPFNFISYWEISSHELDSIVLDQINYYKAENRPLTWRVFDHDKPEGIEETLHSAGLNISDEVTLMVMPVNEYHITENGLNVIEVTKESEIDDYLSVTEKSFGEKFPADDEYFKKILPEDNFKFYLGLDNEEPVAAARFETPPDCSFALFFGGGVIPSHRGKGFYKALVNARVKHAREKGIQYVTTEARETSRPILESLGFFQLTKGRTWQLN